MKTLLYIVKLISLITILIILNISVSYSQPIFPEVEHSGFGKLAIIGHNIHDEEVILSIDRTADLTFGASDEDIIVIQLKQGLHKLEAFWRSKEKKDSMNVYIKPDSICILIIGNGFYNQTTTSENPLYFDPSGAIDPRTGRRRPRIDTFHYQVPYLSMELLKKDGSIHFSEDEFYMYLSDLSFDPRLVEKTCNSCTFIK